MHCLHERNIKNRLENHLWTSDRFFIENIYAVTSRDLSVL